MRERPILFSGPMVRAILSGTKTQTRRVILLSRGHGEALRERRCDLTVLVLDGTVRCPYGVPGDQLWVRESWAKEPREHTEYRADHPAPRLRRWKPSIHMPRGWSRIQLEVTDVRVERVQDIDNDDAEAEGCPGKNFRGYPDEDDPEEVEPREQFEALWKSINDGRGYGYRWEDNPFVWRILFKRLRP